MGTNIDMVLQVSKGWLLMWLPKRDGKTPLQKKYRNIKASPHFKRSQNTTVLVLLKLHDKPRRLSVSSIYSIRIRIFDQYRWRKAFFKLKFFMLNSNSVLYILQTCAEPQNAIIFSLQNVTCFSIHASYIRVLLIWAMVHKHVPNLSTKYHQFCSFLSIPSSMFFQRFISFCNQSLICSLLLSAKSSSLCS